MLTKADYMDSVLDVLRARLINSEYATPKTKVSGKYISPITCPACGEAEAWTWAEKPLSIVCNRKNNCGVRTKTTSLFNVYEDIATKYPPTDDDPDRPAKQFLRARGISEDVIRQSGVKYEPDIKRGGNSCGPAAMFQVGIDDKGKPIWNGRLFHPPAGQGKTHNVGPVAGTYWKMPGMEYNPELETFVVEGILDALSLVSIDYQAIAVLGAGYTPDRFDLSEFGNLVFAFDNDPAGRKATRDWIKHFNDQTEEPGITQIQVSAILPIKGRGDWNDLLCSSADHEAASKYFDKNLDEYRFQAKLALAKTAREYADVYHQGTKYAPGLYPFDGCYYDSWIKDQGDPDKEKLIVTKVSNFTVDVVLATRSDEDEDRPVFAYQLDVKPQKGGRKVRVLADGNDIKSPDAMKGFFLRHGRAHWYGSGHAVDGFIKMVVESDCPVVRGAESTGYDHKSGFFILKDIAFNLKGQPVLPQNGLFKTCMGAFVRPAPMETIKPMDTGCNVPALYDLIRQAWGDNGIASLSFLFSSLFVNQVKKELRFFPFLSLYGDTQTGKSKLVTILNNMQGLDGEGLSMCSANTKKGELRELAKISGMMKALIEGNNPGKTRFDFESILPLYNYGNPLQIKAIRTNDNRTKDLPFHGTLSFVQNLEPFQSRAAKERVISLKFCKDALTEMTKAAFDALSSKSTREFAGFLGEVFKHRVEIEACWMPEYQRCKADLAASIPDNRINENHAVVLCFHRLLCQIFNINRDLRPAIEEIGKAKIIACQKRTLTPADHFFDALDQLPDQVTGFDGNESSESKNVFVMIKDNRLYFNRPKAEESIRVAGIMIDYPERLGSSLQEHPGFIEANKNVRFGDGKQRKAYVFDLEKLAAE